MVIDHEFPPDVRVENEVDALVSVGHEVHVACYTLLNKKEHEKLGKAFIHRKPISKFVYKTSVGALKFPFYFNFWRKFLRNLFEKYRFDAIHIHDLPLAKVGTEFSNRYSIPFVLDLHENWPALLSISVHTKTFLGKLLSSQKQWKKYELTSCIDAQHIITVVEEAKTRLINLGVNEKKISVVSNTLNFTNFKIPNGSPDPEYVTAIYSGGINEHRGLQYVIRGIKYLHELPKPFRLWILGTGSYVDTLKQIAESEGVSNQVKFLGWKPFGEMQTYYNKADVFLIPHKKSEHTNTTIPHKLFQYMYSKRPIIASNCLPIERIITDTKAGIIYQYDDPLDFSNKLKRLFTEEPNKEVDLEKAFQAVLTKYNWEKDKEILRKIYSNKNIKTE